MLAVPFLAMEKKKLDENYARNDQPRPQGFSLKKIFKGKALGTRLRNDELCKKLSDFGLTFA